MDEQFINLLQDFKDLIDWVEETDNKPRIIMRRAEKFVTGVTGTELWKETDIDICLEVALVMYSRLGIEGEAMHTEGSYSSQFESLPKMLQVRLNRFNKGKATGYGS